jgi:hypothetical protein
MWMLTLVATLFVATPTPSRQDLLARFDAARARLAAGSLDDLERAVLALEKEVGDSDVGRGGGGCVPALTDRFTADGYGVSSAAEKAATACRDVDGRALLAIVDGYVADRYGLATAALRAHEAVAGLGRREADCLVGLVPRFKAEGYGYATAVIRARSTCASGR